LRAEPYHESEPWGMMDGGRWRGMPCAAERAVLAEHVELR
jgi:hypothetical protein